MGNDVPQEKKLEMNIEKLLSQIDTLIQGNESMKEQIKSKIDEGNKDEAKKIKKTCENKMREIESLYSMANEYFSQRKEIGKNISEDLTKKIEDTKTKIDIMNSKYSEFKNGLVL